MTETEIARAYCGLCAAERRKRPQTIGTVGRNEQGGLVWRADPTRAGDERPARGRRSAGALAHPAVPLLDPPDFLRAWCRYHGELRVRAQDVLAQYGSFVLSATKYSVS